MTVFFLTLFLSTKLLAQGLAPMDVAPPVVVTPISTDIKPIEEASESTGTLSSNPICTRLTLPPGCLCQDGLIKPLINCQCAEILKKSKQIFKAWIQYDNNDQCVVNYFPGCTPKPLNSTEENYCKKFNRAKNQFKDNSTKPLLYCAQLPNMCPNEFRFRCVESADSLDVTCMGKETFSFSVKSQN
jgi:hypothetical protein